MDNIMLKKSGFALDHNDLSEIQGGLASERYHLTSAELTELQAIDSTYLKLAGGTMSGAIDMGTNQINNVVDPTLDQDAATKKYVDDQDDSHLQDAKDYTDAEIITHTADEDAHHDKLHASTHEVGGDDLVNHDDLTGFVALEHIDWTNATQDFLTTGSVECDELTTNDLVWDKYGASAIGTKEFQYLPSPAPSTQTALKIFNSMDAANSMGLGMFIQHKPTVQRDGIHTAIGGYNMVEGTNFNGSNTITALNFGNYQYFSGLGFTNITSGSVLTDVLAVDVFGANAIDSVQFLAKDIYGVRSIPVISATCTDAYGYYYKASTGGTISGTEYGINLEQPTEGATDNKQVYLQGEGNIHSEGDLDLYCPTERTLELQETVWDDLRTPSNSVKVQGSSGIPSYAQFADDGSGSTGVYTYMFEPTDLNQVFFTIQMPHTYKEGTDLVPHVHWAPQSTNGGNCEWKMEYTIANIGTVFGDTATVTMLDAADGTINKHQVTTGATIDGSGMDISHMLVCRLYRDGGEGDDTFTGDAAFLEFDVHFEINTMGSRRELFKQGA